MVQSSSLININYNQNSHNNAYENDFRDVNKSIITLDCSFFMFFYFCSDSFCNLELFYD